MKKIILLFCLVILSKMTVYAQNYNLDGSPDKRFKENKIYKTPNYNQTLKQPTYNIPKQNYKTTKQSIYVAPTKKNGTPDMRYKQNKYPYSK